MLPVPVRTYLALAVFAVVTTAGGVAGCGSGSATSTYIPPVVTTPPVTTPPAITPTITATAALNGAQIVSMSDTVTGATIYYTLDGSTPTTASLQYIAPFLVTTTLTVNALAVSSTAQSSVVSQSFTLNIPSGTEVWGDDFNNTTGANIQPNAALWTYDTGATGFGNMELEDYCAWASNVSPCTLANPNVYVGTDGYLHIVALQPSSGVYTSARIKTQGLFSLSYGRLEARMMIPEGQGLWPAFWLMGNNFATVGWPICGEMDVMEHTNAPSPDYVLGSVHMPNGNSTHQNYTSGFSAAAWHTYGMIWTKGQVEFYVDSPTNVYASYSGAAFTASGATWPFDSGNSNFIIMNLSVGGTLPGSPNSSTPFPSSLLVDYVHLYTN